MSMEGWADWKCVVVDFFFFFFNDTATTEIYTLSLHDALPISGTTSGVLTYFLVSRSYLLNIIAGRGIRLNFLRGSKAKDATVL